MRGVLYPSFHVLAFVLPESNSPPGSRCHGSGWRPPKSRVGAAGSHSGVPSHREVDVRTAPEFCWPARARAPKAESKIDCYSRPTADSALSAPGSIQSTDPVGSSSEPEKTTTDRPAAVLHSVGSARDNGDSLPLSRAPFPGDLRSAGLAQLNAAWPSRPRVPVESGGTVCVLVADCQRPQSRARLKP